jgi:ATP-binding cassette subfamily B protein
MRSLLGNVGQIYANSLFLENLFEFLDLRPSIKDPPAPEPFPTRLSDGIHFREVTFRYPGTEAVALDAFDLHVPAGAVVALVGSNGAGKSTVLKLLCRFYDPDEGAVQLDGIDLRQFSVGDLRRALTVLFQNPVPYHATFRQNIAYGDLSLDPASARLEAAARAAGADSIAARLPSGYDTMLGKWFAYGTQLSGGEWQRVALARAFLRESLLLVLDEPTSFMDSWAEAEFLDRFRTLAAGRTSLIVTHRFTVAMRADIIHVMERGRIVESGSPASLLERGGRFAESWHAQVRSGSEGSITAGRLENDP